MTDEFINAAVEIAAETARKAFEAGHAEGFRRGYREGAEAAIAIMEKNFGREPSAPKSLLKAVP